MGQALKIVATGINIIIVSLLFYKHYITLLTTKDIEIGHKPTAFLG